MRFFIEKYEWLTGVAVLTVKVVVKLATVTFYPLDASLTQI
jgi:hypothetical protein